MVHPFLLAVAFSKNSLILVALSERDLVSREQLLERG
jgi:hypothetical protein